MKPWLVVLYEANNNLPFARANRDNGTTGIAAIVEQEESPWRGEHSPERLVYGCDSEADASTLQEMLTGAYPRNTYLVAQTKTVSYRPIGERVRAVFTKEGLLPQ